MKIINIALKNFLVKEIKNPKLVNLLKNNSKLIPSSYLLFSLHFLLFVLLSSQSFASLYVGSNTKIGIDSNGNCIKIWDGTFNETEQLVYVSKKDIKNSWSTPQSLSSNSERSFGSLIGILPDGNGLAVWITVEECCNRLYASSFINEVWQKAIPISLVSESVRNNTYCFTIDDSNQVSINWESIDLADFVTRQLRSADCILGNSWNTPVTISTL
jgi:hypothetical protein